VLLLAAIGLAGSMLMRALHRHVVFWESRGDRSS
jgi:NitT/TauT family transport system permease protein